MKNPTSRKNQKAVTEVNPRAAGRPSVDIGQEQFEKLCAIFCTLDDISGFFNCSPDTIENWCKTTYGVKFSDIKAQKQGGGRVSLRRKQFDLAQSGNVTMLIWLGKQYLEQADKREDKLDATVNSDSETIDMVKAVIDAAAERGKT